MTVSILNKLYTVIPSFAALLRYRCEKGTSFLNDSEDKDAQIALLYEAIPPYEKKPLFPDFAVDCNNTDDFEFCFGQYYRSLFAKERTPIEASSGESGSRQFDELEVLALCISCGIEKELLEHLSVFQLLKLISKCCSIKNGNAEPCELSSKESKQLYGITPEKDAEIEAFLISGQ